MSTIFYVLRWIHIGAGFTAFFVAPIAMFTKKGGVHHRRWGKIYFWAMVVATVLSLVLAPYVHNIFLLVIGIFSFHLTFYGRRALMRKRPDKGQTAKPLDYFVAGATVIAGLALLVLGILNGVILAIIFGLGISLGVTPDLLKLTKRDREKNAWFFDHITGMTGSYIAAWTAFSVTNMSFLPVLVRWLWPPIVIVPILSYVIRKYKIKFSKGQAPKDVAIVQLDLAGSDSN